MSTECSIEIVSLLRGWACEVSQCLKDQKDAIQALQALITTITIPITALWAWRRFRSERPLEPSLSMELSARKMPLAGDDNLLHVELHLKNVGRAAFHIHDEGVEYSPWIRIYAVRAEYVVRRGRGGWIDWDSPEFADKIFDSWFCDSPQLVLESGEQELFAAEIPVRSNVAVVNVWVKIWEHDYKDRFRRRPYFWSTQQLFDLRSQIE